MFNVSQGVGCHCDFFHTELMYDNLAMMLLVADGCFWRFV